MIAGMQREREPERKSFEVRPEHLILLRAAWVGWDEGEFGAAAIDCKRPYGNSDVYEDIGELLHIKPRGEDGEFTDWQKQTLRAWHEDLRIVLQIVLTVGYFKASWYDCSKYDRDWREVGT